MRSLLSILAALVVCGCATDPQALKATLPLQIWRAEGEAPHMRPARLEVGSTANGAPFFLTIRFDSDDTQLGPVESVSWQMSIDGYCRDKGTVVRSVLIGPSGQVWRVNPVFVPAGPDRSKNWSSGGFGDGYGGPDTAALFEAMTAGGLFTLAIEDDEGGRWLPAVIDTLTPAARNRLFALNRARFEATKPETVPVAGETPLIMVQRQAVALPQPPRACSG